LKPSWQGKAQRIDAKAFAGSFQTACRIAFAASRIEIMADLVFFTLLREGRANGSRSLRVGGRGFCLGAGKTQSEKNAAHRVRSQKCRRTPSIRRTLCWLAPDLERDCNGIVEALPTRYFNPI